MLQQDTPEDFVIATGETNTVRRCVEIAFDQVGLDWEPHVVIDDAFKRPAEVDLLVGDPREGEAGARLGAGDELRAADPPDGRRGSRAAAGLTVPDRAAWAGPARLADRPHGLQGRLAGALAPVARRGGLRIQRGQGRRAVALRGRGRRARGWPARSAATSARRARPRAAIARAQPDVVFHLAAQSLVRRGLDKPVETFTTNVGGTAKVLEALRATADPRAIVVVTSDKCYRNDGSGHPFREDDPLGGDDPYSASKAGQEHVAEAYRALGLPIATVRAGNVIGGGDWAPDRLLADCMRAALRNEPVIVRAPDAVRPWQHVLGPLDGYLRVAESLLDGAAPHARWNFGRRGRRPGRLGRAAGGRPLAGRAGRRAAPAGAAAGEAPLLRLDATRARNELGWSPQLGPASRAGRHRRLVRRLPRGRGHARGDARPDRRRYRERGSRSGRATVCAHEHRNRRPGLCRAAARGRVRRGRRGRHRRRRRPREGRRPEARRARTSRTSRPSGSQAVAGRTSFTTRAVDLHGAEAILVCVPTPLNRNREPDLGPLLGAARTLAGVIAKGQLVVLESTTFPGTTRDHLVPLLEESGLVAGEDFALAFSPERVDPGRTDYTITNTPKIVGGLTESCTPRALDVYGRICDELVPVSTPEVAEMAKLLENIFRSVNIALVNELAILADRMRIDIWEVVDAAADASRSASCASSRSRDGRPLPPGRPLLPDLEGARVRHGRPSSSSSPARSTSRCRTSAWRRSSAR